MDKIYVIIWEDGDANDDFESYKEIGYTDNEEEADRIVNEFNASLHPNLWYPRYVKSEVKRL